MIRIIMNGCNGHMGQVISGIVAEDAQVEIAAGIDLRDDGKNDYPVFASLQECTVEADVLIDFSSPKAFAAMMDGAVEKKLPVVVCTTGLDEAQLVRLKADSEKIPVLRSANMSLGVNLLLKLLKEAAQTLAPAGFDIEIIEKHHNLKKDAPSGTALAMADSINEALDNEYTYKYDRSQDYAPREKKEIGISAVRGGTIVGTHEVLFAGNDEIIEFNHMAYSKAVFAKGAVQAAKFLAGKPAGYYNMSSVIEG
ncbi:MAG: 4-hydroxy-tetrahydrodipicolinate reductase [Lachnospiraceae bacterium]|nr:4-hydroxy-tetrahydrodipicolinate reductase [Lachnospiraceae bacterium]